MGSGGRWHKFWCDKCQCYVNFSNYETCESICEYCEARENKARVKTAEAEVERLTAEVAALKRVCPPRYLPDEREALLPAEKAMSPGERVEYEGAPDRLRARFHALAREAAEHSAAASSVAFERDHWMEVAVRRADDATKAKTAAVDAFARGEDEGYRRAVEDVLRLLVHPSDKAAVQGLLNVRGQPEGDVPRGGAVGGEA